MGFFWLKNVLLISQVTYFLITSCYFNSQDTWLQRHNPTHWFNSSKDTHTQVHKNSGIQAWLNLGYISVSPWVSKTLPSSCISSPSDWHPFNSKMVVVSFSNIPSCLERVYVRIWSRGSMLHFDWTKVIISYSLLWRKFCHQGMDYEDWCSQGFMLIFLDES